MKTKNIKQKIKEHFFINPTSKLRVREIEKLLKLPIPSVIRYCRELQTEGILTIIKTGSVMFYTGNRANSNFILEKKLFNIKSVYDSKLVEFLKIELSNPVVILFGSYSKGEDIESSDIDLYIETPSKKEINLEKFEKILKRKIQLFRHKSILEIKNKELADNMINGIVLNGFIEVLSR
ncbi:MAG: nucleotidyltransferase domain-containing protein [Candidatus Staskawiczbacteria bacterium]|nr:nucleotidyltransferase domain-containing protein [Candidatus Staskawiczbacteria bacterium]